MADEFAKGLGIATAAGLGWMVLSGWYTTPGFEETQLLGHAPTEPDVYGQLALVLRESLFWVAVLGMLTFWVGVPALNRARETLAERRSE